jgi:ketosteroid isomerase-like protein
MSRPIYLLAVLFGAAVVTACGGANVEQDKNALLALDKEWSQTTKDVNKFVSYYAPDASVYPPEMKMATGAQAINDSVGAMLAMPGLSLQWTPTKAEVGAAGDVGYTTGTYTATMSNAAGNPVKETGKYVNVWKKQSDGKWKVVEDIFNTDAPTPISSAHVMANASALTWGPAPPSLPPGAKMAVISGDPSKPEPFTVRAQLPAGYKIAPHWHPTDEHVTVLSGTIAMAMGDQFDQAALTDLPAGGYAALPATMHHYLLAKTPATIQVHGMGPLAVNYVNPADDPSKK